MPLCMHPTNKNSIVVYDLSNDPADFLEIDAEEVSARLYTRTEDLPEGIQRIPLKEVHINKCPVVIPLKTMDAESAKRLDINIDTCEAHRQVILENINELSEKTRQVYSNQDYPEITDPDAQIYSGGFFSDADNGRMERIRKSTPQEISQLNLGFDDKRLPEMLFRYRARNFPETLDSDEKQRWDEYRQTRFNDPAQSKRTLNRYLADIEALQNSPETTGPQLVVLQELIDYANLMLSLNSN